MTGGMGVSTPAVRLMARMSAENEGSDSTCSASSYPNI
ncbi:hypothetical protein RKD33_000480 [Streptomyces sp. SAI-129]